MSEVTQPPPSSSISFMHVDLLAAAMQKLGITNVSAMDLLAAVKQEQEQKRKVTASTIERSKILLRLASMEDQRPPKPIPPYRSTFNENPTPPTNPDPNIQERRRRLRALMKDAFPDGKFPDPYTCIWINDFPNTADKYLPFVCASLEITPDVDDHSPPN